MDKEKKNKKEVANDQENFILKKIRYYQGSIKDYETFWNDKISEGEREESPETKSFAKRNAELNKAFEIIPVEKDDTVICKDVVSGKDLDDKQDTDKVVKKDTDTKPEKKEKKEEKKVEDEEETVEDAKKEEKGEDDEDDDKKKSKKKDKED